MARFHNGRDDSTDTNSVASHDDRMFLFFAVEVVGVQGFAVLCAQFENVTDFDAVNNFQLRRTLRTRVIRGRVS